MTQGARVGSRGGGGEVVGGGALLDDGVCDTSFGEVLLEREERYLASSAGLKRVEEGAWNSG